MQQLMERNVKGVITEGQDMQYFLASSLAWNFNAAARDHEILKV